MTDTATLLPPLRRRSQPRHPGAALVRGLMLGALALGLAGCGAVSDDRPMQRQSDGTWSREDPNQRDTVFGRGGIDLFGSGKDKEQDAGGSGVAVNAYLWRAALDTVAFMPLTSADPFGGVIITDWYMPPESGGAERFKVNVYILGRALRSDGLKVSVFRQTRDMAGAWADTPVAPAVATDFENAVLTRARQLRMAAR